MHSDTERVKKRLCSSAKVLRQESHACIVRVEQQRREDGVLYPVKGQCHVLSIRLFDFPDDVGGKVQLRLYQFQESVLHPLRRII